MKILCKIYVYCLYYKNFSYKNYLVKKSSSVKNLFLSLGLNLTLYSTEIIIGETQWYMMTLLLQIIRNT